MLSQQHGQLLAQRRHHGLVFGDAFVWRHASMLHSYGKTD
jgi:hypothetical protein